MSYSSLYLKKGNKTLIILGVISFFSVIVCLLYSLNQYGKKNGWQKTAGIDKAFVVNRSPHGFEVIWSTNITIKEDQWVEVGSVEGSYPLLSKAEKNGEVYRSVIIGLNPSSKYYFRIRVGEKTYILPSLLSAEVQTPKETIEKPISPAYGKVILPSTKPYANGLLIYEIDGYYPLAVFTKETGEWLVPLTGLIEKESNSIVSLSDKKPVSIKLFAYPSGNVKVTVGQTRPLRKAIIAGATSNIAQITQGKGEMVLGIYSQKSSMPDAISASIIYPKENAIIPGNAPLIRGTAPSGSDVTVLIQAVTKQYSYRTKSDEKGEWLIQQPLVLNPGKHSITATIKNSRGVSTMTRRTFTIIKSGEQVMGVATGSPTIAPTIFIAPTPIIPQPTTYNPQPTTRPLPTAPIPTRFIPTATPPVTGGGMSGFLFGALFCIVIGTGLVLAF